MSTDLKIATIDDLIYLRMEAISCLGLSTTIFVPISGI